MEYQSTEVGAVVPAHSLEHIAVRPGYCGGKPHIAGHRVKVQHVAFWHERLGKSPDEIVAEHPGLSLADVHAALSYYYDHREQLDADLRSDELFVAALQAESSPSLLLRRLVPKHVPNDPLPPR